ncbi:photosystem II stability/assembly factor HCF136, chloroplastic isoform X3 [Prosopis cineraria]|uniref:photosystem II stability/assembly factor HCF136, chloroplastic isoform X3 n=1 Tax=Prosopis cineraria TaxID=364024 RepID=UPI00240ECF0A|nr:photosystem II stability/assembly factor HCF136, chloroplastic isoform X3 [Prosopis cineraria]
MATLQFTDSSKPVILLRPFTSIFSDSRNRHWRNAQAPARFIPKASLQQSSLNRRCFIAETAAISLSVPSLIGFEQLARSEEALSEWERVYLPIDPGVVLLDIAFVPDDLNHGFLLGTRQTILETKDGGNTWIPRSIPSAEEEDFNYRFNSISFKGKEGWIVGKPAILLYTSNAGESWERIPLSAQLPGDMVYIKATGERSAEMVTDEGAIYITSNRGYNWRAAVQETVSATLNRTVSSGISGASYYTGTFNTVNRSPDGSYVAVSSRGNFYLTWEPGQEEAWAAGGSGVLLRTTNGGKSWTRDKAADNIAANLYSVKFINDKKGFVLGNDGVLLRYLG